MPIDFSVGNRIGRLRRKRGWAQKRLADRLGQTPGNISQLENGKHTPSLWTLRELAGLFEVHPLELIAGLPPEACKIAEEVAALSPDRRRVAIRLFGAIMEIFDGVK